MRAGSALSSAASIRRGRKAEPARRGFEFHHRNRSGALATFRARKAVRPPGEGGEDKTMHDPARNPKDDPISIRERELDEAIEESFPASDPLTVTRTFAGAPNDRVAAKPKTIERSGGKKRRG